MTAWLSVVGIGDDGLEGLAGIARAAIDEAEVLAGGARHLAMLGDGDKRPRLEWGSPIADTINEIKEHRGSRVAVLASGDPMWFGIGATLARSFASDEMRIIPAPSAFSLLAARMGWALNDVECLSVHGRAFDRLRYFIAPGARLLVLANDGGTPAAVASLLVELGYGESGLCVFAHMDGEGEEKTEAKAAGWGYRKCADLNTIAINCMAGPDAVVRSRSPGLPDEAYQHDGQITKREVRAATLAALGPGPLEILWDVGAGCGSISIEWMRAEPTARALAIESDCDRAGLIEENALTLGVPGLELVRGAAPEALGGLDVPDGIFVGGGLSVPGLIETCWQRLMGGGRLVANAVTFEGEQRLMELAQELDGELVRFEISRSAKLGRFGGWEPLKPVTQLRVVKS